MTSPRKKRGRPPRPMPEPIPDTPERIAWAIMQTPPKAEWDYVDRPVSGTAKDRALVDGGKRSGGSDPRADL